LSFAAATTTPTTIQTIVRSETRPANMGSVQAVPTLAHLKT
jgi:hypothetical protein